MTFRYGFLLEYDGGSFSGWQHQKGLISVQSVLERAAFQLAQEKILFCGAGRTDSGVHALGQVAHADFQKQLEPFVLRRGLNFYLKDTGVQILEVVPVDTTFDARFSAVYRQYVYLILNRQSDSSLWRERCWWIPGPLDVSAMKKAAEAFLGHHDFSFFRHRHCQAASSMKTITDFSLEKTDHFIQITVQARSFLHRQVRMMVGTLVQIGLGKRSKESVSALLSLETSALPVLTAPAKGLYLSKVGYPSKENIVFYEDSSIKSEKLLIL